MGKKDFAKSYEQLCWKHASRQYASNTLLLEEYRNNLKRIIRNCERTEGDSFEMWVHLQIRTERAIERLEQDQAKLREKYPRYLK